MPFPELDEWIKQYQKPEEADNLSKMQKELDDTKIILVCGGLIFEAEPLALVNTDTL